jgi:hypothetical protein
MAKKESVDKFFNNNEKEIKKYITKTIQKYKRYSKSYTNDDIFTFSYLYCIDNLDRIEEDKIEHFTNKYISNQIKWENSSFNYQSKNDNKYIIQLGSVDYNLEYIDDLQDKIDEEQRYNEQKSIIAFFYKNIIKDKIEKIIFEKMFYQFKTPKTISVEMNIPYHYVQPITLKIKCKLKEYVNSTNNNTL